MVKVPSKKERLELFKATMRLFGYTWFSVRNNGASGLEVTVRENCPDANEWPAVWQVCNKLGVGWGCGNDMSHQLKAESLPEGEYFLNESKIPD